MPDPHVEAVAETRTRVRRIETRLTSLMIQMGYDAKGQKPEFFRGPTPPQQTSCGTVRVPSLDCSLRAILGAIPEDFHGLAAVRIGDEHITTLVIRDR
jgi:hypothetical protein